MSFNKYNTRNTGRYNNPGQFASAGEGPQQARIPQNNQQQNQFGGNWQQPPPPPPQQNMFGQVEQKEMPPPPPAPQCDESDMNDGNMKMESETDGSVNNDDANSRPFWMKSKLPGVKRISNKERRRRQNQSLRRLLTPKNALMVLNEMLPNEQLATQFQVMPTPSNNQYYKPHSFCADLNLDGNKYTGYGDNKLMARNAAAEQAIRDLIIKRMNKALNTEGEEMEEETLPMIQLASFALHKLFCEWEVEGFKVPQLRPVTTSVSESEGGSEAGAGAPRAKTAKKEKQLPADAAQMHPCMLLTYMRPALAYRELAARGDRPQNMQYTIGLDVDGVTYVGTASNKKEARKAAAKAACQAIFGVTFEQPQVNA